MYAEPLPQKLYEVTVFYKTTEENPNQKPSEIHLVLGTNELDATARLNKYYTPTGPVIGIQAKECNTYTTVIAKRKLYP